MATFIIDNENAITALSAQEVANGLPKEVTSFQSDKQLQKVAEAWPAQRLVEIWNGIPGVKAVTRFTSRNAGVARIWTAIQGLAAAADAVEEASRQTGKPSRKKKAVAAPKPEKQAQPAKTRDGGKKAQVIEMLRAKGGSTLVAIMSATGWQAHTVRGFISGTLGKKLGLTVESTKNEAGERTYRLTN